MNDAKGKTAAKQHADRLIDEIKAAEGAWDETYRIALVKNRYSKFMGEAPRDVALAAAVADALNEAFELDAADLVGPVWYERNTHDRQMELIDAQERATNDIDEAKNALEAAQEAKKSAQATIDTEHSRLRNLARELKKPFVYPLPLVPNRQRELPLADGEEWRAVLLADVLTGRDAAMKGVALEKLGNVTLGDYADLAQKYATGEKPQKLTRKQWDKIEAHVQDWHAEQAEQQEREQDEADGWAMGDDEGDGAAEAEPVTTTASKRSRK